MGVWLVWRARPWRETQPLRQLAWVVLALILVHSLLEYPLWYGPFQIAALLSVWILCSGSGGRALPGGVYVVNCVSQTCGFSSEFQFIGVSKIITGILYIFVGY